MHTKSTSREMIRAGDPQTLPDVWFVKQTIQPTGSKRRAGPPLPGKRGSLHSTAGSEISLHPFIPIVTQNEQVGSPLSLVPQVRTAPRLQIIPICPLVLLAHTRRKVGAFPESQGQGERRGALKIPSGKKSPCPPDTAQGTALPQGKDIRNILLFHPSTH